MSKIYVVGHKNPDTDTVTGAISLSYLKNQLGLDTEACILGPVNAETNYALKKFGFKVPRFLNDVKLQIKNVLYRKDYIIDENTSIMDTFNFLIKESITGIPLVNKNRMLKGYVSLSEIATYMVYKEDLKIDASFINIVSLLNAKVYYQFNDEIVGYALSATSKEDNIKDNSILIIGDRDELIKEAILKNVNLLILANNTKLTSELELLASNNKINVVSTAKSSYEIARILGLANPIKSIKRDGKIISFSEDDYLSDFRLETSKLSHVNYPIVDKNGICLGMMRTTDLNEINKNQVILVDHNMSNQSVDGINEADILEIIDHHNIGDIITNEPISFRNMTVGSVNTIIYHMYRENNVKIPRDIAGLMLSGILSDTLLLKSPTVTEEDIKVANKLSKIASLDINKYGTDLLASGVSIKDKTAYEIITGDFKSYQVNGKKFAIGQVITTDIKGLKNRRDEIIDELNRIAKENEYKVCTLFVTNFLDNTSYIYYSDLSGEVLKIAFGLKNIEQGHLFKGLLSRKKQIVPEIMDVLDE